MNNDYGQTQTEFHNKASAVLFAVHRSFEHAVSNVSRQNEEHKFQQLKKQHAIMLEQELQLAAKDVLAKNRNEKQVNEISQMLNHFIKDYLHRFVQKVNDL